MNREIIDRLSEITKEEQAILDGQGEIDRRLYMENKGMVIDSKKLLDSGKLIRIRPHTRFIHFPAHTHNYIEVIYMCRGQLTHIIDGTTIVLKEGELLFLNQHAVQEILPAGKDDIAVNFIILPGFFDIAFQMLGEEENLLRNFIVGCLCDDTSYHKFLYFQVSDVLPVQNLIENMVWTLLNKQLYKRSINQTTMGLLLLHLMHYTERIQMNSDSDEAFEQQIAMQVLGYIEEHYREASLTELSEWMGYDIHWLSRMIRRITGRTYKELLQVKRLNQAAFLLQNTNLSVADVCAAVGYDNTSYFHRIFKEYYGVTPRDYRMSCK